MYSHVYLSVTDFERALAFYRPLLRSLDIEERFCEPHKPWAGWHSAGASRPLFVIGHPFDGQVHHPGNGQMVAFAASSPAAVNAAYQIALAQGGRCEGRPGLRPQYHAHYYGAYVRDPDGNKLCVVCHEAAR